MRAGESDGYTPRAKSHGPAASALAVLRERAGLTVRGMARRLGIATSSYATYEYKFRGEYLPMPLVMKLEPHLTESGKVTPAEVWQLAGITPSTAPQPTLAVTELELRQWCVEQAIRWGDVLGINDPDVLGRAKRLWEWVRQP